MLIYIVLFVLGASFGSFLNVLISRNIEGKDWVKGRSRCDHCGKQLMWYENIPLLSYVVLGGRCRYCKKKISIQHPLIEIFIALLFVWWGVVGSVFFQLVQSPLTTVQPLYWLIIGFVFVGVFFADLFYGVIPDFLVWFGLVVSFVYRVILVSFGGMQSMDFVLSLAASFGVFLFFLFLYKATKGKGMGYGDVKFSPVLGLVLGWPRVVVGVLASFILGAVFAIFLLLSKKRKFGDTVPFGPFLVFGSYVALVWGDWLWRWIFLY